MSSDRLEAVEAQWAALKMRRLGLNPLLASDIREAYTQAEIDDISYNSVRSGSSSSRNCEWGALGEYGLRKYLSSYGLFLIQNHTKKTQQFHYDWDGELGLVEVKSQKWLSQDFVIQGDYKQMNFYLHRAKLRYILSWGEVPMRLADPRIGKTWIAPFALIDVRVIDSYARPLGSGENGFAMSNRDVYNGGFLLPLNEPWFNRQ